MFDIVHTYFVRFGIQMYEQFFTGQTLWVHTNLITLGLKGFLTVPSENYISILLPTLNLLIAILLNNSFYF